MSGPVCNPFLSLNLSPCHACPDVPVAGYFTSRPAVKGYVRSSSNYLQACRQLEIQSPSPSNASSFLLWESMGIAQHHDAVSGTEKQHVADDYALRLSQGNAECKTVVDQALSTLIAGLCVVVCVARLMGWHRQCRRDGVQRVSVPE